MNKINTEDQLTRMKQLMNFGLNESKQPEYSSVEYTKLAADGNLYGIVREGTHYFIKVAKNPKGELIRENFDYINGFRNRKDNQFESFASAQRYFVEKMMDINEGVEDKQKKVIAEAWDLDEKEEVLAEQTTKIQKEIARQKQIMKNAMNIMEGKKQDCDMPDCPKVPTMNVDEPDSKNPSKPFVTISPEAITKPNIKKEKVTSPKKVEESTQVPLTSREDPEYIDTSKGTEIGTNTGFEVPVKNEGEEIEKKSEETVNEETVIDNGENQNAPAPGVGEKGDADPFEEKVPVTEAVDDLDDTLDDEEDDYSDFEDDEEADDSAEQELADDAEADDLDVNVEPGEDDDLEFEVEPDEDVEANDLDARMTSLESKLDTILDAIQNMKYDDSEPLYDDDEEDTDGEDFDEDDDEEDDDTTVVESKSYRAMKRRMNEEEQYFGKHPAYRKKVMTLPTNKNVKRDGQYDMNDSSVDNETPFGTSKGSQAPYTDSPEAIENSIVEAVLSKLKKKLG